MEGILKNTPLSKLQECTEEYAKNFPSQEQMFSQSLDNTIEKLRKAKLEVGQDGEIAYPSVRQPQQTFAPRENVPHMKDVLILAHDYIDKKKAVPVNLEGRSEDAKLAKQYNIPNPPQGWWMSEKFDGERALWDGKHMVSRGGKVIWIPEWFKALLPPGEALDGELFIGRNKFQDLGFLRSFPKPEASRKRADKTVKDLEEKWNNILFMVFDVPSVDALWEKRMKAIDTVVKKSCKKWSKIVLPPYLKKKPSCPIVGTEFIKVRDEQHLDKHFNTLLSGDAEGVMLRAPNSPYKPKRTRFLLKVKPDHDAECRITGYKPGTGKYSGMLGSFECEMIPEGKKFYISGMTDEIRTTYQESHPIGTIVTYKYTFLTDEGIPRHPRYLRKRRQI